MIDLARIVNIVIPLVFLGIFFVLFILPQQKKEKELRFMRDNIEVGDEVVTIGGLIGVVVRVYDDFVNIEIGPDRTVISLEKWGIGKKLN